MAGTGRIYQAVTVVVSGVEFPTPHSSVVSPREWSTNGGSPPLVFPFTIPRRTASAPYPDAVKIFDIDWAPNFTHLAIQLNTDGDSIEIGEVCDAPTSDTDLSPSGTAEHANILHVEWNAGYESGCPDRPVNTTLSNACGLDSDNVPIGLTHAGTTTGRLYAIWATTNITSRDGTGFVTAIQ